MYNKKADAHRMRLRVAEHGAIRETATCYAGSFNHEPGNRFTESWEQRHQGAWPTSIHAIAI
jgi:hypothetical protein